jgi:hypothetical protein
MAEEEMPSGELGALIGRLSGANIVAITDILTTLLINRAIRPAQASIIMQRMAKNAGDGFSASLEFRARHFMTYYRPRKGKRRLR